MSWISLTVKDIALGAGPHVMWWLLEGIEPSFDACLSPGGGFRRAAEEKNGRKNDHLEPSIGSYRFGPPPRYRHVSPGPAVRELTNKVVLSPKAHTIACGYFCWVAHHYGTIGKASADGIEAFHTMTT